MSQPASAVKGLPAFHRHITTHDAEGKAIFHTPDPADPASSTSSPAPPISTVPTWANFPSSGFGLGYATQTTSPEFSKNEDLDTFYKYLHEPPPVVIPGGCVFRVVDMAPGGTSPLHRTVSIDYGVVLEGEVELELDSGEKRLISRGDLFVQRGTAHRWRNPSDTQPTRLLVVQSDSKEVVIEGKGVLPEFFGA